MALIGNHSVLNKSNAFFINGTATAGAYAANAKTNYLKPSVLGSRKFNVAPNTSIPEGYNLGEAYLAPWKDGGLSTGLRILGEASLSATGISSRLSVASLSGSASLTAGLAVLTPGAAALTGAGTISASIASVSSLASALNGSASFSANLSATVPLASSLAGVATMTPNLTGVGSLEAPITPFTELSPENLASAVMAREVEIGYDLEAALRLILSATAGKVSGGGTSTITIKSVTDGTNRIVATVDSNGNRIAITHDVGDE